LIELRSDTFSLPTAAMLKAMARARLGDDVYGEDPTVLDLEQRSADLLGKEAACLMPSGTMANLACLMAHCPRGTRVYTGAESDIYLYEAAGASVCGGIGYEPVPNQPDGTMLLADLSARLPGDPDDPQFARPALICLENTQNRCGGVVLPPEYPGQVRRFADQHGLAIHLDGARIFNAAVALGLPASELARDADSVQFCLSKGLSAPVGSLAVGSREFIRTVRRVRKMLGGGMRQAGVIAAAGIVALDHRDRLAQDHETARQLASGLARIDGIGIVSPTMQTNIVLFRVSDPRFTTESFVGTLRGRGVAVGPFGHDRIRAVTHSGVTAADATAAISVVCQVMRDGPA
jgi:threonine aldolase